MTDVDSSEIEFQCPSCGYDLKQTIAQLKVERQMICPGCRIGINLAYGCAAASVKAVADRAFLLKRRRPSGDIRFVRLQGIGARGSLGRHAVQEQPSGDLHFNRGRRRSGAGKPKEGVTI
jgi:hypothetical protein